MDKNKIKMEKNVTYHKINIQHMVETVASNDHLLIVKILLWPYWDEYYILSDVLKCESPMCPIIIYWLWLNVCMKKTLILYVEEE